MQVNIYPNPNPLFDIGTFNLTGVTISFGLRVGFGKVAARLVGGADSLSECTGLLSSVQGA